MYLSEQSERMVHGSGGRITLYNFLACSKQASARARHYRTDRYAVLGSNRSQSSIEKALAKASTFSMAPEVGLWPCHLPAVLGKSLRKSCLLPALLVHRTFGSIRLQKTQVARR
jgi:hypothetical protein